MFWLSGKSAERRVAPFHETACGLESVSYPDHPSDRKKKPKDAIGSRWSIPQPNKVPVEVKAFSKEYFQILRKHPELRPFLAFSTRILVVLDDVIVEVK